MGNDRTHDQGLVVYHAGIIGKREIAGTHVEQGHMDVVSDGSRQVRRGVRLEDVGRKTRRVGEVSLGARGQGIGKVNVLGTADVVAILRETGEVDIGRLAVVDTPGTSLVQLRANLAENPAMQLLRNIGIDLGVIGLDRDDTLLAVDGQGLLAKELRGLGRIAVKLGIHDLDLPGALDGAALENRLGNLGLLVSRCLIDKPMGKLGDKGIGVAVHCEARDSAVGLDIGINLHAQDIEADELSVEARLAGDALGGLALGFRAEVAQLGKHGNERGRRVRADILIVDEINLLHRVQNVVGGRNVGLFDVSHKSFPLCLVDLSVDVRFSGCVYAMISSGSSLGSRSHKSQSSQC